MFGYWATLRERWRFEGWNQALGYSLNTGEVVEGGLPLQKVGEESFSVRGVHLWCLLSRLAASGSVSYDVRLGVESQTFWLGDTKCWGNLV